MNQKLSNEYLSQLKDLHKGAFGSGSKIDPLLLNILNNNQIDSLLDFGSGKGKLSQTIKSNYPELKVFSYDPVTSPIELPNQVDCIVSSDVLEHIEPEYLDETLTDLFSRSSSWQYHLIACHPAKKTLPDGRNAHLIIEEPEWWIDKIKKFNDWEIITKESSERLVNLKKNNKTMLRKVVKIVMKRIS